MAEIRNDELSQIDDGIVCVWTFYEFSDDCWRTSCEKDFVMIEGTPKENGYNFCPSCGKALEEFFVPFDDEEWLYSGCWRQS